eukprot:scaffold218651_cov30-Tisochrysis_lutea.AAC.3
MEHAAIHRTAKHITNGARLAHILALRRNHCSEFQPYLALLVDDGGEHLVDATLQRRLIALIRRALMPNLSATTLVTHPPCRLSRRSTRWLGAGARATFMALPPSGPTALALPVARETNLPFASRHATRPVTIEN